MIWLILGERAGDNAQVQALGRALGLPFTEKRLRYNKLARNNFSKLGPGLRSVDLARSDPLEPPWPDLVIAVGRRSVPVVQWIRARSGGRTRLVQLGRPRADLELFDLVVSTPQYGLPARRNVMLIEAPMVGLDQGAMARAAELWRPRLAHLPRPWIALLVGGRSKPYYLDADGAARIAREAAAEANALGGALLVTTSPRTPPEAADALFAAIDAPAYLHRFTPGGENPYHAFLALADRLIVTSESISMLTEAVLTGKPLEMALLPSEPADWRKPKRKFYRWYLTRRRRQRFQGEQPNWLDRVFNLMVERGLLIPPRDIATFNALLQANGLATLLGRPGSERGGMPARRLDDLDRVVARVRTLLD
ncbi:MAG: mitochondrial fission ELM1 family protein [Alphaproteobacteria bacterium]|nr:mitochondrial fission ELM1 family protein [Alphaproteobacteria bacterium]